MSNYGGWAASRQKTDRVHQSGLRVPVQGMSVGPKCCLHLAGQAQEFSRHSPYCVLGQSGDRIGGSKNSAQRKRAVQFDRSAATRSQRPIATGSSSHKPRQLARNGRKPHTLVAHLNALSSSSQNRIRPFSPYFWRLGRYNVLQAPTPHQDSTSLID